MGLLDPIKKTVRKAGKIAKKSAHAVGVGGYAEAYDVVHLVKDPKDWAKDTANAFKKDYTRALTVYSAAQSGNYDAITGEVIGAARELGIKVDRKTEARLRKTASTAGAIEKGDAAGAARAAGVEVPVNLEDGLAIYDAARSGDTNKIATAGLGGVQSLGIMSRSQLKATKGAVSSGVAGYGAWSKQGEPGAHAGAGVELMAKIGRKGSAKSSKADRAKATKASADSHGDTDIALTEKARRSESKQKGLLDTLLSIIGL